MLKIILALIILFLLRDRLMLLKPHWHTLVPAAIGALLGYLWARFLGRYGVLSQIQREIGLPPGLFTLISSMLGAGLAASRGRQLLRRLFPPDGKDGNDVSG